MSVCVCVCVSFCLPVYMITKNNRSINLKLENSIGLAQSSTLGIILSRLRSQSDFEITTYIIVKAYLCFGASYYCIHMQVSSCFLATTF